jgi:GNAT superfamily N-acetyltransferase
LERSISSSARLVIRPAQADDYSAWLALWRSYCAALDGAVPDAVTEGVWRRILTPDEPLGCLLACRSEGEPVGLANYVLHPNTWSLQTICYLEDLFVAAEARGTGAARALIDSLVALGKERGWRRVYWHTREKNYRARTLYDRVVARTDYIRYDIDL